MSMDLEDILLNALNEQGYLFQEACEHILRNSEKSTRWEVKASEYPVALQGQDTKIDIVLRSNVQDSPELYTIVECKRPDPSNIYWLFGAPELPVGQALCSTLGFECKGASSDKRIQVDRSLKRLHFDIYTNAVFSWQEVKRVSNKRSSTPQNIENAFIQVLKGVGGFAQEQLTQRNKSHIVFNTFFLPVVVTTASLYVAYYQTKHIDLATGKINKDAVLFGPLGQPAEEQPWVLLDYGVGEGVDPMPIPEGYHGVDPNELQKHKLRSIFIVNSKSLTLFFSKLRLVQ